MFGWNINFCIEYLYCTIFNNYIIVFFCIIGKQRLFFSNRTSWRLKHSALWNLCSGFFKIYFSYQYNIYIIHIFIYKKYHKNKLLLGTTVSAFNTHLQPSILFIKNQTCKYTNKIKKKKVILNNRTVSWNQTKLLTVYVQLYIH